MKRGGGGLVYTTYLYHAVNFDANPYKPGPHGQTQDKCQLAGAKCLPVQGSLFQIGTHSIPRTVLLILSVTLGCVQNAATD